MRCKRCDSYIVAGDTTEEGCVYCEPRGLSVNDLHTIKEAIDRDNQHHVQCDKCKGSGRIYFAPTED